MNTSRAERFLVPLGAHISVSVGGAVGHMIIHGATGEHEGDLVNACMIVGMVAGGVIFALLCRLVLLALAMAQIWKEINDPTCQGCRKEYPLGYLPEDSPVTLKLLATAMH